MKGRAAPEPGTKENETISKGNAKGKMDGLSNTAKWFIRLTNEYLESYGDLKNQIGELEEYLESFKEGSEANVEVYFDMILKGKEDYLDRALQDAIIADLMEPATYQKLFDYYTEKLKEMKDDEVESFVCHQCCQSDNQSKEEREKYDPLCRACWEKEEAESK